MSWRWPMRIRWARGRSRASSTWQVHRPRRRRGGHRLSSNGSCDVRAAVGELEAGELGALNVRVLARVLDKAPAIPSGIFR